MEAFLAIAVMAFFLYRYVRKNINIGSGTEWTAAKEIKPEDKSSGGKAPAVELQKEEKNEESPEPAAQQSPRHLETNVSDAKKDYRLPKTDITILPADFGKARIFGLVGKPLGHSFSMVNFKKKFRTGGINADYCNFELDDASQIRELVQNNPKICGLNVTIPYKTDIIQYLDGIDDTAKEIGAVNVIKVIRDNGKTELIGYNTDHIGFSRSLQTILPSNKVNALVLGSGGASKAVGYALKQLGIEYSIVSRSSGFDTMGYYELSPSVMESHQLIVNCTPVGMSPDKDQCPDIPYAYITSDHIMFDLIYNPPTTLFMQKGIDHGASVKNGDEMLKIQAEEAWRIWNE